MITIIAGTNRRDSLSSVFAHEIASIYSRQDVHSKILELADLPPETFSPDAYSEKPKKVEEFTQDVLSYIKSIEGFKNLLPLEQKLI